MAQNINKNIRQSLQGILDKEEGINWWKPKLFKENVSPILPSEIKILEDVPIEENNYNCFVYVLGLQNNPRFLGNKNWEFTRHLGKLFDEMIQKKILKSIEKTLGALILYRTEDNTISHVGILEKENLVVSKWSWGPLLKHKIQDVPISYGVKNEFYLITEDVKEYVMDRREKWMTK